MRLEQRRRAGFTLIEVLIAVAVLGTALVVLLHCQLVSIRLADRAAQLTRATLLAEAMMAERLAQGYPEAGTEQGADEDGAVPMSWTVQVAPAELDVPGGELRSVQVEVAWQDGRGTRRVTLNTLVARRERSEDEAR